MRLILAAGAALCALLVGCERSKGIEQKPEIISDAADVSHSFLGKFLGDPQFIWLATLARLYPSEYQAVSETTETQASSGVGIPAARIALTEMLKPLIARHRESAMQSEDEVLVEYLRRNLLVAENLLQENPRACNEVFQGNLDPTVDLRDSTWRLMSDATAQLLIAAKDGEKRRTRRDHLAITQDEFQVWRVEMERVGANSDTFLLLADPVRKKNASDAEKCLIRVQMMQGALRLPSALGAKITLAVLR